MNKSISASFSTITKFEQCPYRVYLNKLGGHKEVSGVAADRGSQIHEAAEKFVKGEIDFDNALRHYEEQFHELRDLYQAQDPIKVHLEEDWCVDRDWLPCSWSGDECWFRAKLDFLVIDENYARVGDYKTGKKFGNEIKHTQQGQAYMVHTFMRYPEINYIDVEFWYLDQPAHHMTKKSYSRDTFQPYLESITKRALALTDATDFPAKPNRINCKWCSFKESVCEYAFSE